MRRSDGKYICEFCNKEFLTIFEEDKHKEEEHRVIYLPIPEENLSQLYQAMLTGDFKKLDERYLIFLGKFIRRVAKNNMAKGKEQYDTR